MSHIRIIKRKARGFFKPDDLEVVKEAVHDVHRIITNASILVRAYYIQWFQGHHPLPEDEKPLELDHQMLSMACNIVQGTTNLAVRGDGDKNTKIAMFNDMLGVYRDLYSRLPEQPNVASKLSLSHVVSYSIENLLTAYENNITIHFPKYPKRFILCDLLSKGFDATVARKLAAQMTNHYLYDFPMEPIPSEELNGKTVSVESYAFLFPSKMTEKKLPRCWDLKVHPWVYLYKMVEINQALETDFPNVEGKHRSLLNPLPFHSSFVPMHVRFDTSGISQLLMTKERIKEFKDLYELEHPGTTLNMKNKAEMLSTFEKLFGRLPVSKEEAGFYATDLWAFLTNLKVSKHWKELQGHVRKNDPKEVEWIFDNAIVTDGVSISFQVINREFFGRKVLAGRKKVGERNEDADKVVTFQDSVDVNDLKRFKVIGCDPGKSDILTITDGFRTIRYTRKGRDQDVFKPSRTRETLKRRRSVGLEAYETQVLNRYPKRSCHPEVFKRYAVLRKRKEEAFLELYGHPVFRQFKFTTYSKTRSSEHKFVGRVFQTFSKASQKTKRCMTQQMVENASKQAESTKDILIGWGNWGKFPNKLKGCAPTPGVGIRKRMASFFKTVTVNEFLTSQTCPCCHGERCLKKQKIGNRSVEKHHLLRCTNDECQSRWWNRNVVGGFNILKRALEAPEEKTPSNETTGVGRKRKQPRKSRT